MHLACFCFLNRLLDGRPQWEVEAKIIRDKAQGVSSPSFTFSILPFIIYP